MTLSINGVEDSECICSGYIFKAPSRQLFSVSWQRKWVELLDSKEVYPLAKRYLRLELYMDQESRRKFIKPKTIILCDRSSVRYNDDADMEHALDIVLPNKVYTFGTSTEYELEQWFNAIDSVICCQTVHKQRLAQPANFCNIPVLDHLSSFPSTPSSNGTGQTVLPKLCSNDSNRTTTLTQGVSESKPNKFSHQIKFFQPRQRACGGQYPDEDESRDILQPIRSPFVLPTMARNGVMSLSGGRRNSPRHKPQYMFRRKDRTEPSSLSSTLRTVSYTNMVETEILDEFDAFQG